jgi:putative ABC transport system substrate-binding protein
MMIPLARGLLPAWLDPGGNITGLSAQAPEISGKQLEVLKEIVPNLARVGVLGDVTRPGIPQALREINIAADAFRVQVQYLEVRAPKDIEIAFRAASKARADALLVLGSPAVNLQQKKVAALAVRNRLVVIYSNREFVEAGGLMSYGVSSPTCSAVPPRTWTRS